MVFQPKPWKEAGGTDRNVETLDAYFVYLPEDRPVLSFE
jgi:hypothetical protein